MHIALPTALAAHTLTAEPFHRTTSGELVKRAGIRLACLQEGALARGGCGSSQWNSGRAWAAWLMSANVRTVVVGDCLHPLCELGLALHPAAYVPPGGDGLHRHIHTLPDRFCEYGRMHFHHLQPRWGALCDMLGAVCVGNHGPHARGGC